MDENALLAEYATLQDQVAPALERMSEIEQVFRSKSQDTYLYDNGSVLVSTNTRFSESKALEMLSNRSLRRVTVTKVDSKLVRKHFPGIYRRARDTFANKVSINLAAGAYETGYTNTEKKAS